MEEAKGTSMSKLARLNVKAGANKSQIFVLSSPVLFNFEKLHMHACTAAFNLAALSLPFFIIIILIQFRRIEREVPFQKSGLFALSWAHCLLRTWDWQVVSRVMARQEESGFRLRPQSSRGFHAQGPKHRSFMQQIMATGEKVGHRMNPPCERGRRTWEISCGWEIAEVEDRISWFIQDRRWEITSDWNM